MTQEERQLIEAIIDKSNLRYHNKQIKELLWGVEASNEDGSIYYIDNQYSCELKKYIRIIFSKIDFKKAYTIFTAGFQMHLENINPDTLLGINDLKKWIKTTAIHYAFKNKEQIESSQIVKKNHAPFDETYMGSTMDNEENEKEIGNMLTDNEEEETDSNNEPDDISKIQDKIYEETPGFDEEPKQTKNDAEWRFKHYLSKMINKTYKDLIEAIMIQDTDRRTLAEEYGWTENYLNTQFNRAWNAFIAVALDDIRQCEPRLFKKYEYHKDMDDKTAEILHDFFNNNNNLKQMASKYGRNEHETKLMVVSAYKNLLNIHKREMEMADLEAHRDEKKQKRLQRLYLKYKKALKEKDNRSFLLLYKYYTFFNGDFEDMAKSEINNNITPNELANKLDKAYEVLDKIEKERIKRDNK